MILDTSFVIDLLAGDDAAVAKPDEIADRQLTISTFVYTEVGVGFDPETPTETRFEEIVQQVTLVPYDSEAARRAVGIQRQLRKQGDRTGADGIMIAGYRTRTRRPSRHPERQRMFPNAGAGLVVLTKTGSRSRWGVQLAWYNGSS